MALCYVHPQWNMYPRRSAPPILLRLRSAVSFEMWSSTAVATHSAVLRVVVSTAGLALQAVARTARTAFGPLGSLVAALVVSFALILLVFQALFLAGVEVWREVKIPAMCDDGRHVFENFKVLFPQDTAQDRYSKES